MPFAVDYSGIDKIARIEEAQDMKVEFGRQDSEVATAHAGAHIPRMARVLFLLTREHTQQQPLASAETRFFPFIYLFLSACPVQPGNDIPTILQKEITKINRNKK